MIWQGKGCEMILMVEMEGIDNVEAMLHSSEKYLFSI